MAKELGAFDLYSISAAGLFSAGFFILPALGYHYAGAAVVLAYPVAALLMLPALFSLAELSTAMPRAGGPYYFTDRAIGPLLGTIAGFGTWLALVLKAGFAFFFLGAYLFVLIMPDGGVNPWMLKGLAAALIIGFTVLNLAGAKETTKLQNALMIFLAIALGLFVAQGAVYLTQGDGAEQAADSFSPFFQGFAGKGTVDGFVSAVALVFLTSAGLIKTASIAEEVRKPDRNIPRVMFWTLGSATLANMLGAAVMVAVLPSDVLDGSVAPVADAARVFLKWVPLGLGVWLVVLAAVAAFAGSGNAGILGASRYPLAMSRDKLIGERFGKASSSGTPTVAILVSSAAMLVFVVAFDIASVAKLASAFNLLVFALLNIAVVVMRESHIESYDPGYKSPFYPWTQVVGVLVSIALIEQMGFLAQAFCVAVVVFGGVWYFKYASGRVDRHGAIYHLFERLGRKRFDKLEYEFRGILMEKGARDEDPFDATVAHAHVINAPAAADFEKICRLAAEALDGDLPLKTEDIENNFIESGRHGGAPVAKGAILPHFRCSGIDRTHLVMARNKAGFQVEVPGARMEEGEMRQVNAFAVFFLVSPEDDPGMHLRILAQIAVKLEGDDFMPGWLHAPDELSMKEILLRDERFAAVVLAGNTPAADLIGKSLKDVRLPMGTLVAMIRREGGVFVPRGTTVLQDGDRLTVIGEAEAVGRVFQQYVAGEGASIEPEAKPDTGA